jgi:hypothetical protein
MHAIGWSRDDENRNAWRRMRSSIRGNAETDFMIGLLQGAFAGR